MRKALRLCFCLFVVFSLAGCEQVWTFISGWNPRQRLLSGDAFPRMAATKLGNLSTTAISLSTLTSSAVIIYKTYPNGYYGKLSIVSVSDSSLTIMFTTYQSDGTTLASSNSTRGFPGRVPVVTLNRQTEILFLRMERRPILSFSAGQTLTPGGSPSILPEQRQKKGRVIAALSIFRLPWIGEG